jgi:hypothetical protein
MSTSNSGTRGSTTLAVVIVLGALVGCAPTTTEPASTTSAAPTASAVEASTAPEPEPDDPSTWIISDTGVGPIKIGGNLADTLTGLPDGWTNDLENCAWTAWWNPEGQSYGVFFVREPESETEPISEISVFTAAEPVSAPSPLTAEFQEGIEVASAVVVTTREEPSYEVCG